jgi:hypothetical protein
MSFKFSVSSINGQRKEKKEKGKGKRERRKGKKREREKGKAGTRTVRDTLLPHRKMPRIQDLPAFQLYISRV